MTAILVGFGTLGLLLLFVIPIALWYAFVASFLWEWFIVPIFNAPVLSTWQMWAVVLTLGAMRPKFEVYVDDREIDWGKFWSALFIPFLSLGLGAVTKFWILA